MACELLKRQEIATKVKRETKATRKLKVGLSNVRLKLHEDIAHVFNRERVPLAT